jgi:hypothetical protein
MAEEKPSLHIDTDWKKQAQEEKRRLAEEEQKKKEQAAPATPPQGMGAAPGVAPGRATAAAGAAGTRAAAMRGQREMPVASFPTLVQSTLTQVLFYLGDLAVRGGESAVNLDMAKHHVDTLNVLEEKTKGNLTDEEKRLLDAALYESRMRYISVAQQYIPQ